MDKKIVMEFISTVKILLLIMKDIGKMTWKMVKGGSFLKMGNILDVGKMTKSMDKGS